MSEYHKIKTLYECDERTFKIKPELNVRSAAPTTRTSTSEFGRRRWTARVIWRPRNEATAMVRAGFQSRCAAQVRPAEGAVGRSLDTLYDRRGERLIVKLKTKDFAGAAE